MSDITQAESIAKAQALLAKIKELYAANKSSPPPHIERAMTALEVTLVKISTSTESIALALYGNLKFEHKLLEKLIAPKTVELLPSGLPKYNAELASNIIKTTLKSFKDTPPIQATPKTKTINKIGLTGQLMILKHRWQNNILTDEQTAYLVKLWQKHQAILAVPPGVGATKEIKPTLQQVKKSDADLMILMQEKQDKLKKFKELGNQLNAIDKIWDLVAKKLADLCNTVNAVEQERLIKETLDYLIKQNDSTQFKKIVDELCNTLAATGQTSKQALATKIMAASTKTNMQQSDLSLVKLSITDPTILQQNIQHAVAINPKIIAAYLTRNAEISIELEQQKQKYIAELQASEELIKPAMAEAPKKWWQLLLDLLPSKKPKPAAILPPLPDDAEGDGLNASGTTRIDANQENAGINWAGTMNPRSKCKLILPTATAAAAMAKQQNTEVTKKPPPPPTPAPGPH